MAKDHFIPAALMARFSEQPKVPARSSGVAVVRTAGQRYEARVDAIGYANKLYDVDPSVFPTAGTSAVDDVWRTYEGALPAALDRLIDKACTAIDLVDTLVPFIGATFARDRGYDTRVASRFADVEFASAEDLGFDPRELVNDKTNIAINRVLEMDRHAARALASDWIVYVTDGDIILPDVGYGFDLVSEDPDVVAPMLPIGPRHLLSLVPSPDRRVLVRVGDGFEPAVRYESCATSAQQLNEELAKTAQDFVVGSNEATASITPAHLGVFTWEQIDEILSVWPYNLDTRALIGVHHLVHAVVHGEIESLDNASIDRFAGVAGVEPQAEVVAPFGRSPRPAADFLRLDDQGLHLTASLGLPADAST